MTKAADEVRIALISDTHAWPGSPRSYGTDGEQLQPWSELIWTTLLSELRAAGPDTLFHLGDLTCGGGVFQMPDADFYATLDRLHLDLQALPGHWAGLPGNHDCPSASIDYSYGEQLLGLAPRQGTTVDTAHARCVLLNAQGHSTGQREDALPNDPVYGWVDARELERLENALATAGQRPVLLFCHQLLAPWRNERPCPSNFQIENADAVLALLARYGNVRAVFQGHAHLYEQQELAVGDQLVRFVITPPLILYPLGWLLLTLNAEALHILYRPLPLPDLATRSRDSGAGQGWRLPESAGETVVIPL